MHKFAIIVAGGTGQRMNTTLPKQMLPVLGKEIIIYTIEKFLAYDTSVKIIVVIHESLLDSFARLLNTYKLNDKVSIVTGGDTRFQSVKNGLHSINSSGIVAIHDAARPLVSTDTIQRCYEMALQKGNAIPVVAVNESIREVDVKNSKAAARNRYKIVQTPQCFQIALIKKAFEQPYSDAFTDDATVLEATGEHINLVEGNVENIKITHPVDLKIAELFLK